jgi:hypothetical protein
MGAENLVGAICAHCERTTDLEACIACGKTICPSHRFGLGSVSDGYTCTLKCAMNGYSGRPKLRLAVPTDEVTEPNGDLSHIRSRPVMGQHWFILALIIAAAAIAGAFVFTCGG